MPSGPLTLDIDPASRVPIYRQIETQIADAIHEKRLQPGDRLASSGELAELLVTSPRSVGKAYRGLVDHGLCMRDGLGLCVSKRRQRSGHEQKGRHPLDADQGESLLTDELELARQVQRRQLPPPHIDGVGYAISARSRAARIVAGDFHDVILHPDGSVGAVVADVAGKGLASGLITASVKATLPFVASDLEVDEALGELNRRLCSDLGTREFVALVYARFDPRSGRLRIANAGMPSPYLLRTGELPAELAVPGPRLPLGLNRRLQYLALDFDLDAGDRLLLLSDGLPEAAGPSGEPLGYERFAELLVEAFSAGCGRQGGDGLDRLFSAVAETVGVTPGDRLAEIPCAQEVTDDWTALLLERTAMEVRS